MISRNKLQALLSTQNAKSPQAKMTKLVVELLEQNLPPEPPLEDVLPWLDVVGLGDIELVDGTAFGENAIYLGSEFAIPIFAAMYPHLSADHRWWSVKAYAESAKRADAATELARKLAKDKKRFRSVAFPQD
jgi:hypothetical protein